MSEAGVKQARKLANPGLRRNLTAAQKEDDYEEIPVVEHRGVRAHRPGHGVGVDDYDDHARTGQCEGARVRARGCAVRRRGRTRWPGFRALLDEPAAGPRFPLL